MDQSEAGTRGRGAAWRGGSWAEVTSDQSPPGRGVENIFILILRDIGLVKNLHFLVREMVLCRKVSMSTFSTWNTLELEFTASTRRSCRDLGQAGAEQGSKGKLNSASKLKKSGRNTLFLSRKLANSLKKVRLRKKEKSANNNFLYQKKSSLINDQDFKFAQDLPIIPFSPNHLMESAPGAAARDRARKQKHQEIKLDQLNVWNIEKRRLENLICEARLELSNEAAGWTRGRGCGDGDYVEVHGGFLDTSGGLELGGDSDYVDMASLRHARPRLHSF